MTEAFEVRLEGIPRQLVEYGVERTAELVREFRLMLGSKRRDTDDLPARITGLFGRLQAAGDGREALVTIGVEDLPTVGSDTVEVQLRLPVGSEVDAVELALLLDESDAYCARGEVLTLARPPALVALRWWQATEIVRQRHGLPPTAYPR